MTKRKSKLQYAAIMVLIFLLYTCYLICVEVILGFGMSDKWDKMKAWADKHFRN